MHISRMDPSVEPFVQGETFTHYAVAFYSPKWMDDIRTTQPNSDLDAHQIEDMNRFCDKVNGTMFRWSGQTRASMAKNDPNHRFYPVGAAWSKYMLIVGFNM